MGSCQHENQPFVQIAAQRNCALTKSISQLNETLPIILNKNNNMLSDPIYEDTTSLFQECFVKEE
jgi:hypothetical protein